MTRQDPLSWLLEVDLHNPGVRYFALTDLLDRPLDDPAVIEAQRVVMDNGPVPVILSAQDPQGFWIAPGYYPKYQGTVWSMIFLSQLGADGKDARVKAGCEFVLNHNRSRYGGFSADSSPAGMIHCLQGNLAATSPIEPKQ